MRASGTSTGAERRDPNEATDTTRVPNAVTIEAASRADLSRLRRVALERDPPLYMYTASGRDTRKSPKMQWEHGCLKRDRTFGKHGTSTAGVSSQWSGVSAGVGNFAYFANFARDKNRRGS